MLRLRGSSGRRSAQHPVRQSLDFIDRGARPRIDERRAREVRQAHHVVERNRRDQRNAVRGCETRDGLRVRGIADLVADTNDVRDVQLATQLRGTA